MAGQIAKLTGAGAVYGVVSGPAKADYAREVGYDDAFLTETFDEDIRRVTAGRGVDLVLDSVGGQTLGRGLSALARFGRLISYGNAGGGARLAGRSAGALPQGDFGIGILDPRPEHRRTRGPARYRHACIRIGNGRRREPPDHCRIPVGRRGGCAQADGEPQLHREVDPGDRRLSEWRLSARPGRRQRQERLPGLVRHRQ